MEISEIISTAILLATIFAIIYGPIKAVKITRDLDDRREREARKLDLFRNLMRTRQMRLSEDHVFSLNLVEIEFSDNEKVIADYRQYMKHLSAPLPSVDQQEKFLEQRTDHFVDLLHSIGKAVGYTFDRHELGRFGYAPVGWGNDHERQAMIQNHLLEILQGKRPFPVAAMLPAGQANPYPPAPQATGTPGGNA